MPLVGAYRGRGDDNSSKDVYYDHITQKYYSYVWEHLYNDNVRVVIVPFSGTIEEWTWIDE